MGEATAPLRDQPRAPRERLSFQFSFADINEWQLRLSILGVRGPRSRDPGIAEPQFKVYQLTTSPAKRK